MKNILIGTIRIFTEDEVKARNIHDIAYWMVDDDYDGSNFVVKQVFFCSGDKDADVPVLCTFTTTSGT